jgi:hypothetical protein
VVGGRVVVVVVLGVLCTGDDPPEGEDIDGVVVSVVGEDVDGVVVSVVGEDVDDVEGAVVSVVGEDVEGVVVDEGLFAELAPGCSLANITPMSAVAPVAARIDARVRRRNRALARRLVSGECWFLACLMCGGTLLSAPFHRSRREFRPPQCSL